MRRRKYWSLLIILLVFIILPGCASKKVFIINPEEKQYKYKVKFIYSLVTKEYNGDNPYQENRICLIVETELNRKEKEVSYANKVFNDNKMIGYTYVDGKGRNEVLLDRLMADGNKCNVKIQFIIKNDYFDLNYTLPYKDIYTNCIEIINEVDDEDIQIEVIQQMLSISIFNEGSKKEIKNLAETILRKRINKYRNSKNYIKYINSLIIYRDLINKQIYKISNKSSLKKHIGR